MSRIIPRTCTVIRAANAPADSGASQPTPLERFRDTPVYVLLGDPGAGKTTAFKREYAALGDSAAYVTARDFLTFEPESRPEWRGKTLFIDGLDECRAGAPDKRTSFDRIRRRLAKLGNPRFRLSCRAADWLGENDRQHLEAVTPQRRAVTVLQLDPLTDAEIKTVAAAQPGIASAETFLREAKERGLDGLLGNPQSLDLLATVVAKNGTWPQSRLQTFEQACQHLATEQNDEHRHSGPPPDAEATLDAAGRLCAMLLITGSIGFAADPYNTDDDYLDPEQCAYALGTKLFTAGGERRFIPVHRHLAEFLAARHIERLISGGLPWGRVVALITGEDDGVVTEHRGLAAWLAAHCKEVRCDLIERDPIGVISYGDVHDFTIDEKRTLLSALRRDGEQLGNVNWSAAALGSLVTRDLMQVLRHELQPMDEPFFSRFVLLALTHGKPLPEFADFLFDLACQPHHWVQLPRIALSAFINNCLDIVDRDRKLKQLLDDIHSGRRSDWDNELLGTALTKLYPKCITASEIWEYLPAAKATVFLGPSDNFWRYRFIEQSSDSDVEVLMDELVTRRNKLMPALKLLRLAGVPLNLLARGIELYGHKLNTVRLCNWLSVGIDRNMREVATDSVRHIRSWLELNPERLMDVIAEITRRPADVTTITQVEQIRYGARFPPDYGLWCLQQAVTSSSHQWTRYLLCQSRDAIACKRNDQGLTLEVILEHTKNVSEVCQILNQEILVCHLDEINLSAHRKQQGYRAEQEKKHHEWIAYVRSVASELHTGRCDPNVLYLIASAYYGLLQEAPGDNPEERVRKLFRDEDRLVEAAFSGIRGTLSRDDVPEADKIVDLTGSGREYRIGRAFLAAMELVERDGCVNDRQVRQALAFFFSAYPARDRQTRYPGWYRKLLVHAPAAVADILIKCVASRLRSGAEDDSFAYHLLVDNNYAGVAQHAVLPLLDRFPLRCKVRQLRVLDYLLHTGLRHIGGRRYRDLITERLSRASMSVAQRVHWLAMGVVIAPDVYLDRLQEFVQPRETRITHLVDFLDHAGPTINDLSVPTLTYLIDLLGSTVGRWPAHDIDLPSAAGSASSCVYEMIERLAILPDPEAGAALDALASDTALDSWRDTLTTARDRQRVIRRDAAYQHASLAQVRSTLRNGPPANASDLAALLTDRLDKIAVRIRTGNTDDWRQYWNVDQHGRPCTPRPENSCRDALLSDLRSFLPKGVDAQPEGAHANDRRSDMRVAYRDFHVPVEAKRSNHRDLWIAIRRQLIEQYASDPATRGYGVYLVFWFGTPDTPRPPGGGAPPGSAAALREQLEETLTENERRLISIRVIDVSAPPKPRRRSEAQPAVAVAAPTSAPKFRQ